MDFDPKKNYYELLGVSENATTDEIKKAFKKAAIKHHPDKQGGDQKKFQEVNEAHQVLSDEKKRQQYDYYRKNGVDPSAFSGFGGGGGGGFDFGEGGGGFDFGDIGDLLGGMFGGGGGFSSGGRTRSNRNGEDIKIAVEISFEDSFLGTDKKISYNKLSKIAGVDEKICSVCSGRGKVTKQMHTPFGVVQTQAACDHCGGAGKQYFKNGKEIGNFGLEKNKETVEVKIPAAIHDGTFIKFTGKGNAGMGNGGYGDLYIRIDISQSNIYERKGENLYVKANVSVYDLVLGGEISIDHPEGKMKVKIPKGTQIHDMVKLVGKGFGDKGIFAKRGDMYIIPKLDIPKKLSKEEEGLRIQLKKLK